MLVRSIALAAVFTICAGVPVAALSQWMTESTLNRVFSGQTIEGHYADGTKFVESYAGDGQLDYRDDKRQTKGRWSLQAGTFCTIYDADPSGGCYRVQQAGENCYEFYFAARTVEQAQSGASEKPSWTARGWVKDKASTCSSDVGV